ncbi:hypothetical protein CCMSSC00406_0007260 [Pleurotus cornucopiae]|uniref:Uncharacterized protein n=1 Tax=Pleurotus cornucopiae TaxID=5321 RepID=A0ACB7IJM8_PLECO|nr:hypothetical protein CCMSSC00406_0007260 [Pleurotus cornucopiae]
MTTTSADNANASSSQTQPAFAQDLAVTCQGLVDDFHKARSTKLRSVQLLVEALAPKDNDTDDIKRDCDRALTSYISMLDEHERSTEKDDDDIASPPTKKPIDESLFPFANSAGAPGLHPDLVETLLHKENYLRDLSLAKQRVLARPDCPDFPRSLWKPLLGGEFIDLDKILSGIYSLSGERKEVQKFGDFEVINAGIKVTRHVTSHGEWNIAWAQYRRTLLFTFPHRRNELDAYEAHIIGLFTAAPPLRVIQFDRAVRQELQLKEALRRRLCEPQDEQESSAGVSTRELANRPHAAIPMHANSVVPASMAPMSVNNSQPPLSPTHRLGKAKEDNELHAPRFFRGLLWNNDTNTVTPSIDYTERCAPIPPPPVNGLLNNHVALNMIHNNPHLFKIVTPIRVQRLTELLETHPNRPLVDSVIHGFTEGFWLYAETEGLDYPDTWEEPNRPMSEQHNLFLKSQIAEEERLERYSAPFGPDLLPGMYCMPLGVVPKPHSDKFQLVNDFSAGNFSLNSLVDRSLVHFRPDNVQDLGQNLLHFRHRHPDTLVWLFKSDVSGAYRRIPLHFLWQIRQIITHDGQRWVDRYRIYGINLLLAYVDDTFSYDDCKTLLFYEPYQQFFPAKQFRLLMLWDELGIPHEREKQLFGRHLIITGFDIKDKQVPNAPIYLNADVIHDLSWVAKHFESSSGIHVMRALAWKPLGADLSIYCDAATSRSLAFWVPIRSLGFVAPLPEAPFAPASAIFFFEALAVLSALQWAASLSLLPKRLAIYSDSMNTVQIFDSMQADKPYNSILFAACDILIASNIDLRVYHIPGSENIVTDALSRSLFHVAAQYDPNLAIHSFETRIPKHYDVAPSS